jgi:hypothetical protein
MFRGNLGGYGILPYPRSLKGSSRAYDMQRA